MNIENYENGNLQIGPWNCMQFQGFLLSSIMRLVWSIRKWN